MNELLVYAVLALVGLAIGYFLGNYIQNLKTKSSQSALLEREQQLRTNLSALEQKLLAAEEYKAQLQSEKEQLGNQIVRYQAEMENLDLSLIHI